MSIGIPAITQFTGLPAQFLGRPAASSGDINSLLFGSSNQLVPIDFGQPYTGIPPFLGGAGFQGFQQPNPFLFGQPSDPFSQFSRGGLLSGGLNPNPGFFGEQVFNGTLPNLFGSTVPVSSVGQLGGGFGQAQGFGQQQALGQPQGGGINMQQLFGLFTQFLGQMGIA